MVISIDSKDKGLILIVDNKSGTSNFLFKYLTNVGYQVVVTHDEEIATEGAVCPDLILLNIPEAQDNEFDIFHCLKYYSAKDKQIPIILMISRLETREQIENFKLNIVDYIFKPINQQVLIARIETHLKLKQLQQSLVAQEEESKILFKLSENIRQSLNLEAILQQITVDIQKLLKCDRVVISSYKKNYTSFVAQAFENSISPIIPETYSHFLSEICGFNTTEYQQYQKGNIQVIEDINNNYLKAPEKQYLSRLGIKAQLTIPICIQNINQEQVKPAHLPFYPQLRGTNSRMEMGDSLAEACPPLSRLRGIISHLRGTCPRLPSLALEWGNGGMGIISSNENGGKTSPGSLVNSGIANTSPLQNNSDSQMSSSLWGWLIIHQCNATKIWQQKEIKLLQHLVSQIAIAIRQGLLDKDLQQKKQQLQKLALYDPRTQVYNRRYLDQQLSLEWRRLQRIPSPVSIIICDVDYFEAYKGFYGRQAGNRCLHNVAQIISQAIRRPADFVSLYSEEKFAIILPHTPLQGAQKVAKAIQKMINQLQLPHVKSAISSCVTLSFGIASTIPNAIESPSLMMEAAEQALYIAKSRGRNCFATYNQEISQLKLQPQQELTWSKRLHHALEKNLFCLYAQSIEPLDTEDQRQHFEILLRLKDQDDVIIGPNDFLPIANRYSMMPQIDSWVIENLFTQLAEADSKNYRKYVFTINLSGASLNDDIFLDFLQTKIVEYNLDPKLFCFEITESVAINNIPKISAFIKSLKNLGCSFALDDFGTGMSSLTYLKELPVDYIKIDGSFIREINNDSITKSMVIAINNLAQIIGLKTIAEFVEDQAILKTIQDLKVDYAQGFYFGKPCLLNKVISS